MSTQLEISIFAALKKKSVKIMKNAMEKIIDKYDKYSIISILFIELYKAFDSTAMMGLICKAVINESEFLITQNKNLHSLLKKNGITVDQINDEKVIYILKKNKIELEKELKKYNPLLD